MLMLKRELFPCKLVNQGSAANPQEPVETKKFHAFAMDNINQ